MKGDDDKFRRHGDRLAAIGVAAGVIHAFSPHEFDTGCKPFDYSMCATPVEAIEFTHAPDQHPEHPVTVRPVVALSTNTLALRAFEDPPWLDEPPDNGGVFELA